MKPKKKTTTPFPPKGYRHKVWEGDDMRSGKAKVRPPLFGYEDNVIDRRGGPKMGMDLLDLDSAISRIKTEILPGLDTMVKGWIQIAVPALKTAVIDAGVAIVNRALGGLDDQRDAIKEIIDGLSFSFKRVDAPTPMRSRIVSRDRDAEIKAGRNPFSYTQGVRMGLYKPHTFKARTDLMAVSGCCAICSFGKNQHPRSIKRK